MKIRTQKDIDLLAEKIKIDFDIDISKYRNEEVVSSFAELLILPQYVINWGIRPILVALLLYLLGFMIIDLDNGLEFIIYLLLGCPLFLLCGFLFAIVFLIRRMKYDLGAIMQYSIEILKEAAGDISDFNKNLKQNDKKEGIKLLYLGIMHIVTIPSVTGAIKRKNTIIGYPLSWVINKILTAVGNTVTVKDLENSVKVSYVTKDKVYEDQVLEDITNERNILQKVIDMAISVIEFPFKFVFIIVSFLLIGLIYLLH